MKISWSKYAFRAALIIFCFQFPFHVFSQLYLYPLKPEINIDSLLNLPENIPNTEKIDAWNALAFHYSFSSSDSCRLFAEKALELSIKKKHKAGEAAAYRNLGHAWNMEGDNKKAIGELLHSLDIFETLEDPRSVLEVLGSLAKVNYDAREFERAIEYNKRALDLAEQMAENNTPILTDIEMAMSTGLFGVICSLGSDYESAEVYLKKSVHTGLDMGLPKQAYQIFVKCLAEMYDFMGAYDSALVYTFMALDWLPDNHADSMSMKAQAEEGIGSLYIMMNEPERGIPYAKSAFDHYRSAGALRMASMSARNLGDAYKMLGNNKSALEYYEIALEEALLMRRLGSIFENDSVEKTVHMGYQYFFPDMAEIKHETMILSSIIITQSKLYKYWRDLNEPSKSVTYLLDYSLYKDTLYRLRKEQELEELQQKYETEKMEQQVTILSQENQVQQTQIQKTRQLLVGLAIVVLLLVVLGWIMIRQNRMKNEQDKLVIEQKLLRVQMNPHFIFNALAGIQNMIISQDAVKASIYLSRFSDLVRNILNSSVFELVALDVEVRVIENYLELQKVRYPERFEYSLEVDPLFDKESLKIPPMIAQPFIENAIEHGFKNKGSTGHLEISFTNVEQKMVLKIKDDGVGRQKAKEQQIKENISHISLATKLTRQRMDILNKKLKEKITLKIIDLEGGSGEPSGTSVIIGFPVIYQ